MGKEGIAYALHYLKRYKEELIWLFQFHSLILVVINYLKCIQKIIWEIWCGRKKQTYCML